MGNAPVEDPAECDAFESGEKGDFNANRKRRSVRGLLWVLLFLLHYRR